MMLERDKHIMHLLSGRAHQLLPDGGHVWLYGSRARGEATDESDWDILILLDKDTVAERDFDTIAYPLIELGWEHDAVVNPQIYSRKEWEKLSFTPYYKNVVKDKIEML